MGLFTRKPVLPDYTGMSVEERMKDPAWYDVVSRVPGFSNATLVTNADNGHMVNFGADLVRVSAGILTITPERVGWAYAGKHEISQSTQPVERAELRHKPGQFFMLFGGPTNSWTILADDHTPYLEAFRKARGYI